jgi:signal transduction histidine kinase
MRGGTRVITPDIEACEHVAGTSDLAIFRQTGIRAVQTTPLVSRSGKLLGAISTHWRTVHEPAESELRLFDVLARQAADLIERTQAERQLKEADRRKDEFLAMLAHELRNPLAAIVSAVQLSQADGATADDRVWIRETLARQTDQLGRLVDDLLDMARIANDRIELKREPLLLSDAISRAIDSARPLLERARHKLSVLVPQEPIWISADPARLQQILSNLLTNAAKYTQDGGQITVRAWREGDQALVAIKDNGIGLTPEMQARVFELFAQAAQGLDRAQGGLGIGLTLVRRLVERHGGTVSVHSDGHGRGSEFTVRLPACPPSSAPGRANQGRARPLAGALKILVVDDNRDAARALSLLLKSHGHDTALAYDGREALEVAARFQPAIALLDLGLPEVNGFELAVQLKQRDPQIQLVAISGYGQEEDRRRSRAAGIEMHFVKPVKLESLMTFLEQRARAAQP